MEEDRIERGKSREVRGRKEEVKGVKGHRGSGVPTWHVRSSEWR